MLVTPTPGLVVRDPVTMRELPAEGISVSDHDLYWARLARDEDVTLHHDLGAGIAQPEVPPADPVPAPDQTPSNQGEAA